MFLLALAMTTAHAATIHTVDPALVCSGNPNCYSTIGAAVSAASNGDTITVYAGTYNENVLITGFDDLHIVAANIPQPTLIGALDLGVGGAAVTPAATVNGGAAGYCFSVDASRDVSVIGFRMTNCPTGIQIFNSSDTVVEGNTIGGSVSMAIIDGSGVYSSRITGNSVTAASSIGILLRGSENAYVADNRVAASALGVYVSGTYRSQLVNNRVSTSGTVGMTIIGAAETRIERNTVASSGTTNLDIISTSTDTSWVGNRVYGSWLDAGVGSAANDNN